MTTSVALCTYNGASYIQEQIESILNQTMPVDEIVICDDGSTDDTLQIINKLRQAATIDIRVYKNENQLGVSNNFQKAINLCQGDIIFLSDQDDIWMPEKVEKISNYFNVHSDIEVVFSNALLIEADGSNSRALPGNLWDYTFRPVYQKMFNHGLQLECFLEGDIATGATMAIKKTFRTAICTSFETTLHDYSIAIIAAKDGKLGYVDNILTKYRLHTGQTCSISKQSPFYSVYEQIYIIDFFIKKHEFSGDCLARAQFVKYRIKQSNRLWGPLNLISHTKQYITLYGKMSSPTLSHDVSRWFHLMLKRFHLIRL